MAKAKQKSIPKPEMVGRSDNVYIYQAALYCEDDGNLIRWELDKKGKTPDLDYDFDSGIYPSGPIGNGGGESDSAEFCDAGADCVNAIELDGGSKIGQWLGNDLTQEGVRSVVDAIQKAAECMKDTEACRHKSAIAAIYIENYARNYDEISDMAQAHDAGMALARDLWRESDHMSSTFPIDKEETLERLYDAYDVSAYSSDAVGEFAYAITKRAWKSIIEDPRQQRLPGIAGRKAG